MAATDQNDALAFFSDYGTNTVDIGAPGVNIYSLLPTALAAQLRMFSGTNTYSANELQFTGPTTSTGITATMYYCGLGNPTDFPAAVSNNIALIQRGTLYFTNKVINAMAAGARAAIIYNNVPGNFSGNLGGPGNWIPAVSIAQADGLSLQAVQPTVVTVVNQPDPAQIYQYLDGTSMATPRTWPARSRSPR